MRNALLVEKKDPSVLPSQSSSPLTFYLGYFRNKSLVISVMMTPEAEMTKSDVWICRKSSHAGAQARNPRLTVDSCISPPHPTIHLAVLTSPLKFVSHLSSVFISIINMPYPSYEHLSLASWYPPWSLQFSNSQ